MASQRVTTGSRLTQMQMRFQEKQVQEREQKREQKHVELVETPIVMEPKGSSSTKNLGKVRQMFDERRRGAGIDRSNLLKPISTVPLTRTKITATTGSKVMSNNPSLSMKNSPVTQNLFKRPQNATNNSKSLQQRYKNLDEMDNIEDDALYQGLSSISLGTEVGDRNNNKNQVTQAKSTNNIKLKPILTKHSTPAPSIARSPPKNPTPTGSVQRGLHRATFEKAGTRTPSARIPPGRVNVTPTSNKSNSGQAKQLHQHPPIGMGSCSYCGRNFLEERLAKHEDICRKAANSKRKVFNITKQRIQGTEAEKYMTKPMLGGSRGMGALSHTLINTKQSLKKNNWRKKHEDFIAAIRSAKQLQVHLAKGGKITDLPPPPPTENPDYIQCPHCMRRFNEAAAERHIPKCATMQHNKPRPGIGSKKR